MLTDRQDEMLDDEPLGEILNDQLLDELLYELLGDVMLVEILTDRQDEALDHESPWRRRTSEQSFVEVCTLGV